ncbi:MAG: PIN domain-containing protein [Leucobacter sp.]
MTPRRIVLDANILIRAMLGVKVGCLLAQYADSTEFCAPSEAFQEAEAHLPHILKKRGICAEDLSVSFSAVRLLVFEIPVEATDPLRNAALRRIGRRDPDDWPVVAAALALDCPIWTEDRDFFGAGVATWTSDLVEIYLQEGLSDVSDSESCEVI